MPEERAAFAAPIIESDRLALGERLRRAREYVGLKQEDVAKHLEIHRSALSNIEAGSRKVEVLELTRMAKLYQRPLTWFTSGETETAGSDLPIEVAHVARAAASLSKQDCQELANFADFLRSRAKTRTSNNG